MSRCVEMLGRGAVDVAPLISLVAPLSEGVACFERLRSRDRSLIKIILTPGEHHAP
jgi:threonine dehydrogenase-like Zn-dependent dehydrogenase